MLFNCIYRGMRFFLIIALVLSLFTSGIFLYLSWQAVHSRGSAVQEQAFEVRSGENFLALSLRLKNEGIVSSRFAFIWQLVRTGKTKQLIAGTYTLSGNLSPAEIATMMTEGMVLARDIKVTFPEGWGMKKMAARLTANHLPGAEFLALAERPKPEWRERFVFLRELPEEASLEGFLFPDTYFFDRDVSPEDLIEKMLENFDTKIDVGLRTRATEKHRSFFAALTLASIVENEVRSETDRRMVSDLFLRRMAIGQALESDATVKYILGIDKIQHTFEETRVTSPYNTYVNAGLPPGPIGNPGLAAIRATVFPQPNPYFYFLSDPQTGETIFAVTYEEHLKNKNAHGL